MNDAHPDGSGYGADDGPVARQIHIGRSCVQGSVMDELFAVRRQVAALRGHELVCGAWLHVGGWFVHWVEGPGPLVSLLAQAGCPSRVESHVIHDSFGPRRLEERLLLQSTQWRERTPELQKRIAAVERAARRLEPAAVWDLLSEPCEGDDALATPEARIGVVAVDDNASVDLVRAVASRFGRAAVYQRVAGAQPRSPDMGMAYVDVRQPAGVVRLSVIPRRGLGSAHIRAALRRCHRLVLLPGDREGPANDLFRILGPVLEARHDVREFLLPAPPAAAAATLRWLQQPPLPASTPVRLVPGDDCLRSVLPSA